MKTQFRDIARRNVDFLLGAVGLERVRRDALVDYRDYIPFQKTLAGAEEAGLSVGDYIEAKHNQPGTPQETLNQMAALGVFANKIERVCEIGPGSGRYLEKTLESCSPSHYEIYETAADWEKWLVQKYNVVAHPADGRSLSHTPSRSIDLVQAHKVLSGQPSLIMCRYFAEMARVTRDGGKVVFDIVTEDCLDDSTLEQWFKFHAGYQCYPCLVAKQFAIDFFCKRGFSFAGSFIVPMRPGKTECMVFTSERS